jgi:lipoate-protein ligase A
MRYAATTKVSGGKLLRVKCEVEGGVLTAVSITGDFFIHPEDGIVELEKCCVGMSVVKEEFVKKLHAVIVDKKLELIGFSTDDIVQTLWSALHPDSDATRGAR